MSIAFDLPQKVAAAALIGLCLLLASCEKAKPVLKVNDAEITESMIQNAISDRIDELKQIGQNAYRESLRPEAFDMAIRERLLLQGAKENNIKVSEEEIDKEIESRKKRQGERRFDAEMKARRLGAIELRDMLREKIMVRKFMDSMSDGEVAQADVIAFYQNSPIPFLKDESAFMRFIQINSKIEAISIMRDIKARGKDFDGAADKIRDEKKGFVSDYGWVSPGFFSPQIASAIRNMKTGSYGGPYVGKEDGYYIIKVKDRRLQTPKTFDEAAPDIYAKLSEEKRKKAVDMWVGIKRQKAKIVIYR